MTEISTKTQYCYVPKIPERKFDPNVSDHRARLIRNIGNKWVNGTTLHYYFFEKPRLRTDNAQKEMVRKAFDTWMNVGIGIKFQEVFSSEDAEIKIGFDQIMEVNDSKRNLFLLHRDRIDLVPFVDFSVGASVHRSGYDLKNLVPMIEIPELSLVLWITVSKSTSPEIVQRIANAYAKVKASGKYTEIMEPLEQLVKKMNQP